MVLVIARFSPKPERRDDMLALLREVQAASREEEGCINYGYYESIDEPGRFVAVEEWRDQAALDEHSATPHVGKLLRSVGDMADGMPEIAVHQIAGSGDLPI